MPSARKCKYFLVITAMFFGCCPSGIVTPAQSPHLVPQTDRVGTTSSSIKQGQTALAGNVAQVPIKVFDHLVFVPVRVNGSRPSFFLLDTARATSSIDDVRAAALGLLAPIGATAKALANISLGFPGLNVSIPSLALDSFGDLSTRIGRAVQGVLGSDVLSRFVVIINYDRQTLQFYDPNGFAYKGNGIKLKMEMAGGVPTIEARVSVRHRGSFRALFSIATAQAEGLQFSPQFSTAHKFSDLGEKMILFSQLEAPVAFDDHLGRVESLQIGKIVLQNPIAIFPGKSEAKSSQEPQLFGAAAGALGGEILGRFTLVLDYPGKSVILVPNAHIDDLFVADMSGLVFEATPPDFRAFGVARVIQKSPAELAGIAVGDMIEKVDGDSAADFSLDDLRALLRQDGTEHVLTIVRNGKTLQFTLKLKPLI